jgi:hypothetical protein
MSEWQSKVERMAHSTIHEDVYIIAGVPSWTMVLANKILEITGKSNLKEVWPNLELFMHGGVNFEPYRSEFKRLMPGDDMHFVETYNASEGFFGIQDLVGGDQMLLMLDYGVFFEFIPMDAYAGVHSKEVYSISQVEADVNYAVVISTNGGLWRYILGDTIRFTSTSPYRFKITGRTKSFINAFGEELIVENAELAVTEACKRTQAQIRDYTAAPVYMEDRATGCHEWVFEFVQYPNDMNRFMQVLDEKLRECNADYDAKRYHDLILDTPRIKVVDHGVFDQWLEVNNKLGGQNKIPRLCNDRTILEQILSLANTEKLYD